MSDTNSDETENGLFDDDTEFASGDDWERADDATAAETDVDTEPERDTEPSRTDRARAVGESLGDRIGAGIAAATVTFATVLATIPMAVLTKLPKGVAIGQALHKAGLSVIKKNGGAQFVALTIYGDGEIVPRPAGIDPDTKWVETNNGEEWVAENGVDLSRVDDVPVMFAHADAHEPVSPIRARIAEKIDSGDETWRIIEKHDNGQVRDLSEQQARARMGATGGNGAVADGGVVHQQAGMPKFDDIWVDLSNWVEEADGMVVSMKKAYETTHQKGSAEAFQTVEDRARIAERFGKSETKWALYLLLAGFGGIALGMFGPSLAQSIAGGGGGLGGVSPLMIEPLGAWW